MRKNRNTFALKISLILLTFFTGVNLSSPVETTSKPPVNAAIVEYQPAVAIRASACITCHAKIESRYITDFGYGDSYYFGSPGSGQKLGPFNGHIYGDFYGAEPNKTGWATAEIEGEIIVPAAAISPKLRAAAGKELAAQQSYKKAFKAASLAKYLQSIEDQKIKPSRVIEKKQVFIGAPDAATLRARFGLAPDSDVKFKYLKTNGNTSPEIEGIEISPGNDYFANSKEIVCDGDLFIDGSIFLDGATISTRDGCRIYATGPIFMQNPVTYKSLDSSVNKANLQLVSSEAILLGVGNTVCKANTGENPLSRRLLDGYAISTFLTRAAHGNSISPEVLGKKIYDQGRSIKPLEDSSCHDDTLSFSRLLLNAPQIHNRYKGKFKGVIIGEIALFRLGQSVFEFDPVFKEVPVLPVLRDSDYLLVE